MIEPVGYDNDPDCIDHHSKKKLVQIRLIVIIIVLL